MERKYCVYVHINKDNGKVYVGFTNDILKRWSFNGINYKPHKNQNQNRPFWNAIQKYGFDSFNHFVLESDLTFEEAIEKEKYYIGMPTLANLTFGAIGMVFMILLLVEFMLWFTT